MHRPLFINDAKATPEEVTKWRDRLFFMSRSHVCEIHPVEMTELYRVFLALEAEARRMSWLTPVLQVRLQTDPPVEGVTVGAPVVLSQTVPLTAAKPEVGSVAYEKMQVKP